MSQSTSTNTRTYQIGRAGYVFSTEAVRRPLGTSRAPAFAFTEGKRSEDNKTSTLNSEELARESIRFARSHCESLGQDPIPMLFFVERSRLKTSAQLQTIIGSYKTDKATEFMTIGQQVELADTLKGFAKEVEEMEAC